MQGKNNKNKKNNKYLALYISNPVIYGVMRNENKNKEQKMTLGKLIEKESKFKKDFAGSSEVVDGYLRLSVFNAWCIKNGIGSNSDAATTLQYRLYNDGFCDVQFDASMDRIEGRI